MYDKREGTLEWDFLAANQKKNRLTGNMISPFAGFYMRVLSETKSVRRLQECTHRRPHAGKSFVEGSHSKYHGIFRETPSLDSLGLAERAEWGEQLCLAPHNVVEVGMTTSKPGGKGSSNHPGFYGA